jgi:PAS domain-containing protein
VTPGLDAFGFGLSDMARFGATLRRLGESAASMESAARAVVDHLYRELRDSHTGQRACALVRFYKTHPLSGLPPSLRERAACRLGTEFPSPATKCLTLLATAGDRPEWNARDQSRDHQAFPLPTEEMLERFPMIAQLLRQLEIPVTAVLKPDPALLVDLEQRSYNVFHVAEARGSPHVPAQRDFVIPEQIRSVLGFGGMFPTGDLFAVILFSRAYISRQTADLFRTLALSVKLSVLPFDRGPIFDDDPLGRDSAGAPAWPPAEAARPRSRETALEQLLEVQERVVREQAARIERALGALEARSRELRHQTEVLQSILDNMGDGVVGADASGKLTLFNRRAEQLLGIGLLDIPPDDWSKRYGIFQRDQVTLAPARSLPLARALQGEACNDVQLFVRNQHRSEGVWITISARPLRDEEDQIKGAVVVFREISPPELRRTYDLWRVSWSGSTRYLRDSKGMRYLARLLGHAGREWAAFELIAGDSPTGLPDAAAVIRGRLRDVADEIASAEDWHDQTRLSRAQREQEHLEQELASAMGLSAEGGASNPAERARQSVTKAIKGAIKRIAQEHADLGRHLESTVHTGLFCSYTPDPLSPPSWWIEG